ncbi:hypothetical protein LSAT2_000652 [Lamellibrachia satsuma]|nr:hypothetical protein LSAT2_000652 [Lamellibrachia satsuma]
MQCGVNEIVQIVAGGGLEPLHLDRESSAVTARPLRHTDTRRYIAHLQVRSSRRNRRDRTIAAMVVVIATLWDMSTATGPRTGATATPTQRSTEAALTTSDMATITTGLIQKVSMAHIARAKPPISTSKATPCSGCIRQVA